ncbi:ProQ activator of osmoprotectant transporter prop [Achromobacter sp. MYb9]|uniref:ProQ/FinO family protein n=1 Tax=Achromobacter sp. MYb9 TaxID=1827284 RepID=UPI000CFB4853|nr:ProQ/FinO family protein [Achromobacter sp. MYb9]PQZ56981.1 ProQ activator of osmoprotectant transporter prop [Achromobacter sp. MYb9]
MITKQAPEEPAPKKESRPQGGGKGPRSSQGAGKGPRPQGGDKGARPQGGDKGQRPQRAERRERETPVDPVVVAISRLQRHFPKAFPKNPAPKLPLKLGVLADLVQLAQALQLDEAQIKEAVKTWCDGRRYWTCMVEDAPRVDLNGEPSGAVTANEAKHAKRMASRSASKNAAARNKAKKAEAAAAAGAPAAGVPAADEAVAKVADGAVADTTATDTTAPAAATPAATEAPAADASADASNDAPVDAPADAPASGKPASDTPV